MTYPDDPAAQPVNDGINESGRLTASTSDTWDRAAASYDTEREQDAVYQACVAAVARAVQDRNPRRLLDVGCGTGLTTLPLCRAGRTVVAVDFSLASLAVLRNKTAAPPVLQADVRALPFLAETFDVVLCANTLQHLRPDQQVLAVHDLERLVAPGGALVVSVHHYSKAKQRAGWIKEGRPGQPGIDYIYRFAAGDLRRILPEAHITAIGFGEWPWLPAAAQKELSHSVAGPYLAKQGYGHMLLAVQQRKP